MTMSKEIQSKIAAIQANGAKVVDLKKDADIRKTFGLKSTMKVQEIVDFLNTKVEEIFSFTKSGKSYTFALNNTEDNSEVETLKAELAKVKAELAAAKAELAALKSEKTEVKTEVEDGPVVLTDKVDCNNSGYSDLFKIRRELGWSREKFDSMVRKLRDEELINITIADRSRLSEEDYADCFTDENGFTMRRVYFYDTMRAAREQRMRMLEQTYGQLA